MSIKRNFAIAGLILAFTFSQWDLFAQDPDTVRAIQNLFKRKRGLGVVCIAGGAIITPYMIVEGVNYEPKEVFNNGIVKIEEDKSASYIIGSFNGVILMIVGAVLSQNNSKKHERIVLERYANGYPLPKSIKMKLKKKDFRIIPKPSQN